MPRTIESSTITTLLPSSTSRTALYLTFTFASRVGLRRLDECAADVVIANERELVGQPALLGESERGGVRRVGHAEHELRAGRGALPREPPTERAARAVDRAAEDAAVRAREVDVLEHAALRAPSSASGKIERSPVVVDRDDLARLDIALVRRADDVERARLGREHDARRPSRPMASGRQPRGSRAASRVSPMATTRLYAPSTPCERVGQAPLRRRGASTAPADGRSPRNRIVEAKIEP